jgi:hypothetical protein
MTTRTDILNAHNKVSSAIQVAQLWSDNRNEAEKAATLLRDTALKAIPGPEVKTATQLHEMAEKAEMIAQGNDLDMLAAVMPYLLKRQEGARMYMDRPSEGALQYLEAINKKISELLNIF